MFRFVMVLVAVMLFVGVCQGYPGRLPQRRIRGESVDSVFFSPFRVIGKRAQISGPAYDDLGEYLINPDLF
uniref:COesterase domain-containing protein n=1 Tax=Caenorhabditis tropicalis TaxID=1561998 RepID=A0A1I7T491_9PELO